MASPSAEQVQAMINDSIRIAVADLDNRFGMFLGQQVTVQDAQTAMKKIIEDASTEFVGSRQRINELCTTNNDTFADHKQGDRGHRCGLQRKFRRTRVIHDGCAV